MSNKCVLNFHRVDLTNHVLIITTVYNYLIRHSSITKCTTHEVFHGSSKYTYKYKHKTQINYYYY